jgi:hypothetical protein
MQERSLEASAINFCLLITGSSSLSNPDNLTGYIIVNIRYPVKAKIINFLKPGAFSRKTGAK